MRNPFRGRRPAPVQELPRAVAQDRWEPIPEDIAEWMGMRPYVAPVAQQAAAS